jgi:hypothetical protein
VEEVGVLFIFRAAVLLVGDVEYQVRADNASALEVAVHGW